MTGNPILRVPREFTWSCGVYTPSTFDLSPVDVQQKVEAMMMCANAIKDENGKPVAFTLPPALALAILDVIGKDSPMQAAHELISSP